jgi:hypothetical protein
MPVRTAVADGADPIQQKAAADAVIARDGTNLLAVIEYWHQTLRTLHRAGVCSDDLINHPVCLAVLGKLSWMCRLTFEREMAALAAVMRIEKGEAVEYEVIYPLGPGEHLDTSH